MEQLYPFLGILNKAHLLCGGNGFLRLRRRPIYIPYCKNAAISWKIHEILTRFGFFLILQYLIVQHVSNFSMKSYYGHRNKFFSSTCPYLASRDNRISQGGLLGKGLHFDRMHLQ